MFKELCPKIADTSSIVKIIHIFPISLKYVIIRKYMNEKEE